MNEKKELKFEEAIDKLEKIVKNMESQKLSLDEMMKNYEEGKKLSDYCAKILNEYEKKIEVLIGDANSENPQWQEFKE